MSAPRFETLTLAVDGALARITLNRPERLNAIGAAMMRDLIAAAKHLDGLMDVRVAILAGAGRAFCAVADLPDSPRSGATPPAAPTWHERREQGQLGLRMADALEGIHIIGSCEKATTGDQLVQHNAE